jgi:capsular polysaccharide biosynthesis protein
MLSVGLALLTDFFSQSFRTPEEATGYLGAPVLASIPKGNENAK